MCNHFFGFISPQILTKGGFMRSLFCITLVMAFLLCTVPAMAERPAVPADGIQMNATKKKVVVFNHSTHTTVACEQCHHPVEGKADYRKCSTAGCHDSMDRKDKSVRSYYKVMHDKKLEKYASCISCHVAEAAKAPEKKKALLSCKGSKCHP